MSNPNQLIRIKQVVQLLSISESTVRRYVKAGILPSPTKLTAKVTVWKLSQIEDYINSNFNSNCST